MAISVPSDPKVYTTKYANMRGVDYTNDPSNVWYRRSPSGVNMLPDLDGRPYKRNGWKVEFSSADFCTAAGILPTTVEQYKVDYFELGGIDWLVFYTSIGLFFYGNELEFIDTYVPWVRPYRTLTSVYAVGDYCYRWTEDGISTKTYYECSTAITIPEAWTAGHWTELADDSSITASFPPSGDAGIDYTKSFFFEGGGTAGYYLFAGTQLFCFDGKVLKEVEPKIPLVLFAADPSGAGTLNESVNMLTQYRTVQYMGDGVTAEFEVPSGYVREKIPSDTGNYYGTSILNVYVFNTNTAQWEVSSDWEAGPNAGAITFDAGHIPAQATEDNVRITYIPAGSSSTTESVTSSPQYITITKLTTDGIIREFQGKYIGDLELWNIIGTIPETVSYEVTTKPKFSLSNPKSPLSTYVEADIFLSDWDTNNPNLVREFDSYGSTVTLTGEDNGKTIYDTYPNAIVTIETSNDTRYQYNGKPRIRTIWEKKQIKTFNTRVRYTSIKYQGNETARSAFFATSRALVFGNGIVNQVFLTSSSFENYSSRVWYSAATDPTYFPDTNYIEAGATDKKIMGLITVGEYLGIVKQGSGKETSIYLAYPTSFDDETTYAVKQSVNGVGAVSNGAFNILNDEPLFLSPEGIMGIEPQENDEKKIRNRSYYINKPLVKETSIESAFSFVFDGMYWLGINNHCYVLDGAQKNSWENTKTNLQYEAYYLDNIPAKCFAKKGRELWFIDTKGNACRFKKDSDPLPYVDETLADLSAKWSVHEITELTSAPTNYKILLTNIIDRKKENSVSAEWTDELRDTTYADGLVISSENSGWKDGTVTGVAFNVIVDGTSYESAVTYTADENGIKIDAGQSFFTDAEIPDVQTSATYTVAFDYYLQHETKANDVVSYQGTSVYTVVSVGKEEATLADGVPIHAVWGTIADDDGSANYYKKLQKKGSLVALLPGSQSGVKVYVKPDEKDAIFVGETSQGEHILPFNYYMRKKVKKYKRLQIICENDAYNVPFGVDEIIKCYTLGSYAKK